MTSYIIAVNMKRPQRQEIYAPADVKIPSRLGGGVLKERVIRELPSKKVVNYALAYINPLIFGGDNGRVLGYDNSHHYAHRHYMGAITADPFTSYDELYERFEREWQEIAIKFVNGEQI
jgi:CHASE1-domain containing sensor protein